MKRLRVALLVLGLLGAVVSCTRAQEPEPVYATTYIESNNLSTFPHRIVRFPMAAWWGAINCLQSVGVPVPMETVQRTPLPNLIIVERAEWFVVRNFWLERALGTSPVVEGRTTAYALVDEHAILATETSARDLKVMRHEALHFFVWWLQHRMGHPPEIFDACAAQDVL